MKRTGLCIIFAFFCALGIFAQTATVTEIAGKVEYQVAGKEWRPARVGDILSKGTLISTGFKSTAVLKIANTMLTVKPVTRLSLEEIVKTQDGTQTQVFLVSGRVAADVTPQKDQKTDFKVSSPTATASVRGTSFEFDGVNIIVERGKVEVMSPTFQYRYVSAGEFTYVAVSGSVQLPAAVEEGQGLENIDTLVNEVDTSTDTNTVDTIVPDIETPTASVGFTVQ